MQDSAGSALSSIRGSNLYRADQASHLHRGSGRCLHADFRGKGLDPERRDLAPEQRNLGEELPHARASSPFCHAAGAYNFHPLVFALSSGPAWAWQPYLIPGMSQEIEKGPRFAVFDCQRDGCKDGHL